MPDIKVTDDQILALYQKGTPLTHIPANNERIRKVLSRHGINERKLAMRHYAKKPGTAPPNEWIEQLKATAKQVLPRDVPIYTGTSRTLKKMNDRRRMEARTA